jgi:hypothetical protein
MVVAMRNYGIAFFGAPKSAGTSIYHALHELITGAPWDRPAMDIHKVYSTDPACPEQFDACRDLWCFTVVRDPVRRFLSAYQNRVHDLCDLDQLRARSLRARFGAWRRGVRTRPPISEFLARYDAYTALCYPMLHHTRPISAFIGHDLGYFDAVYTIADLDALAQELSVRTGKDVKLRRFNEGSRAPRFEELPSSAQARLLERTAPDYALLQAYFTPPDRAVS